MRRLAGWLWLAVVMAACSSAQSAPRPVSAGAEIVAAPATDTTSAQQDAVVAYDGTNYLVAWSESRGAATGSDVLAVLVSPSGALIGSPFVVSGAAGDQLQPSVAFDGTRYLVVWLDQRVGGDKEIYGARVSTSGQVLDPSGVDLSRRAGNQVAPVVGFDGTSFLVAWEDRATDLDVDVYATRVSGATGQPVEATPFPVSSAPGHQVQPAIACNASSCLLAWRDGRNGNPDVWAARVSGGAVLDPLGIAVTRAGSSQGAPSVGSDGGEWLVAWNDARNGNGDVYGARVAADGTVRDAAGIGISTAPGTQQAPAVSFEGAYYVVAWEDSRSGTAWSVYGARLDRSGTLLDASGFGIEDGTSGRSVRLASDRAGRVLVVSDPLVVVDPALAPVTRMRARFVTVRAALSVAKIGHGDGTITSSPAGIDCGGACSTMLDAPTAVSLVATPDASSAFMGWSGDCSGAASCDLTLDMSRTVTARFSPYFTLDVSRAGGTGSVRADAGIDCGATCSARLLEDTPVRLVATADAGYAFTGWTGPCAEPASDPARWPGQPFACTFAMAAPTAVTAAFAPAYKLSASVTGAGTLGGAGLECASGAATGCTSYVLPKGSVTLVATPAPGAILKSWGGACAATAAPGACTLAITGPASVSAQFQPAQYPLTATVTGAGTGTVTGPGVACTTGSSTGCVAQIDNTTPSTVVVLHPAPAAGSLLKAWSGACYGQAGDCSVTMTAAKTATARFEPTTWPLTITIAGVGAGTVTGPSVACTTGSTAGCVANVDNTTPEQLVHLVATPAAGNVFKGWRGACYGLDACDVTMSVARAVSATFEPATWILTASATGAPGTITGAGLSCATGSTAGCTAQVDNTNPYQTVTLTARPDPSSILKRWTGCSSTSDATCTVYASGAKTVSAYFEPSTFRLSVAVSGSGAVTGDGGPSCAAGAADGCGADVANGATTVVTGVPQPGWILKRWTGCASTSGDTCSVAMTGAKSVTAWFEPATYALTVGAIGGGGGTVTGAGLSCAAGSPDGCSAQEANGSSVTLTAAPDAASIFKGWTGCSTFSGTTCTVTMSAARNVTVQFQPSTYPLTAAFSGPGGGVVTADGFTCATAGGAPCTAGEPNGATVTLVASPDQASVFRGWSGCTSIAGDTCTVWMTGAHQVTATFQPSTYALTVSATGSGVVSGPGLACSSGSTAGCTTGVANGDTVALVAAPDPGWILKSWTGCPAPTGETCTTTMTAARTIGAVFQPASYPVTLAWTGGGGGVLEGAGVTCATSGGAPCTAPVANGGTATFTVTPDAASLLKGWTGCSAFSGNTCTVVATAARTITAQLQPSTYRLSVALSGTGSVSGPGIACAPGSADGCAADEPNGDVVTLTATPADGWLVKSWSGCTSWSGATCSVPMSMARNVTATFQPTTYALTISTTATGKGTVTGPGISCAAGSTAGCAASFANGDTVTLTAAADPGYIVKTWAGCLTVSGDTCTVSMTAARTVTVYFQPATYPLTVTMSGTGSGTVTGGGLQCTTGSTTGCTVDVPNGAEVTLTAAPGTCSSFASYSGACSGTSCTVFMGGAQRVAATFTGACTATAP